MLNKCMFIGHVGADPEIRRSQTGKPIANMRIAVTEKWRSSDGERKEKTEWVSVVIFNEGLCKVAEQYVKKGSKVYICGQLQTRKWQDQTGNDRYSTEIVLQNFNAELQLLDGKQDGDRRDDAPSSTQPQGNSYAAASGRQAPARQPSFAEDMDDSLPPF